MQSTSPTEQFILLTERSEVTVLDRAFSTLSVCLSHDYCETRRLVVILRMNVPYL